MSEQNVVSITAQIKASKRASAIERAWHVAKTLEGDREQIRNLEWVEPEHGERGIERRVDFDAEFPEGREYLQPVPLSLGVCAPAAALVPDEDLKISWTMPLLTRMSQAPDSLDTAVRTRAGFGYSSPSLRNTIDVVSFLPFPQEDAPPEEQFRPEFFVAASVGADLGAESNYFAAVARYGGKVIKQHVNGGAPKDIFVWADPTKHTLFNAEMLVNLGADELAQTPDDAGELEIFIYRIKQGPTPMKTFDYGDLGDLVDFPGIPSMGGAGYGDTFGSPTRGGFKGPTALPSLPQETPKSPAEAPKQVGDVRLGEGSSAGNAHYETLEGYVADPAFPVQHVRLRFLGVREASGDAARAALTDLAAHYD